MTDTTSAVARALARLYDLDFEGNDPGDVDLYLAIAARTGDPVLELAAGTGRLAVPLAAAGHRVTAVDLDPAMIERGKDRAAAAGVGPRIAWVERDLVGLADEPLPDAGRFRLGILALNSLFVLGTRTAQAAAFRALRAHLAPGGLAVVDVWLPSSADLAGYDGRLVLDHVHVDPASGGTVTKTWAATYEAGPGTVVLTTLYEEGLPGEPPVRWVRRDAMRLVSADELQAFAEAAGLEVETLAGDRELGPIGPGSERAVLVARRPEP